MGTRAECISGFGRTRRDHDLLHDAPRFFALDGGRPVELPRVVLSRAASEDDGEGGRGEPVVEAGDEDPNPEDRRRRGDEIEEDEEGDGKASEAVKPLRVV